MFPICLKCIILNSLRGQWEKSSSLIKETVSIPVEGIVTLGLVEASHNYLFACHSFVFCCLNTKQGLDVYDF